MSAHTPGPWSVSKCCCGHPVCKDFWISSGKFCQGSGFEEANARLIAAAPDLLEALLKLDEAAETSDDCQYGTLSTSFVRDIARAAIARAIGESA